jgi:hypothetical protein
MERDRSLRYLDILMWALFLGRDAGVAPVLIGGARVAERKPV